MPHKTPEARREYQRQRRERERACPKRQEQLREGSRKWRVNNRDGINATSRLRYQENREAEIARTRAWQIANPEKAKALSDKGNRKARFARRGLTESQFYAMLDEQSGCCALCKQDLPVENVQIDHCHTTMLVRGLLCRPCNVGLGMFQDDPAQLRRAIAYLETAEIKALV